MIFIPILSLLLLWVIKCFSLEVWVLSRLMLIQPYNNLRWKCTGFVWNNSQFTTAFWAKQYDMPSGIYDSMNVLDDLQNIQDKQQHTDEDNWVRVGVCGWVLYLPYYAICAWGNACKNICVVFVWSQYDGGNIDKEQ